MHRVRSVWRLSPCRTAVTYTHAQGQHKGVVAIAINRPDRRNAVDPSTAKSLHEAFLRFDDDADAQVCVLHGEGGTFCSGYDLKALATQQAGAAAAQLPRVGQGHGPMGPTRLSLHKPVIAAIEGYAVAGGLELALLCDLRVAAADAVLGVFCRRFGVPLIDGGTVRLPKLIGLSRAMDLILTGRAVHADEALSFGLVNRVVPTGLTLEVALNLAASLTKFPQECMRADRESAYFSTYEATTMTDALAHEFDQGIGVIQSESVAGAKRFSEGQGRGGSFE